MKFLAILFTFFNFHHPYYLSSFDVQHNAKEKSIEISVRAFTDDMETALKKFKNLNYDLSNNSEKEKNNSALSEYVSAKFFLNIDGQNKKLNFVGYELNKESTWMYFEILNITQVKNMKIDCNFLLELNNKQNNIISATANNKIQNIKLDFSTKNAEFKW